MRNPNGYGSIIKLSGNRRKPYGVRITVGYNENGSQKYKYLGYFSTKKDAMIALAQYNENPYSLDHDKLTFKDIYEQWAESYLHKLAKTSKTTYTGAFNHCKDIYNVPFKKLNTLALQSVIKTIDAPTSKHAARLLFNQLFKYAMKYDIVQKDYSKLIDVKKPKPKRKPKPFTEDEIAKLWESVEDETAEILLMLIYSGFRITELLELKKENIHIADRYIIGGKKSFAGIDRVVPIHKKTLPFFERRLKEPHLFSAKQGGQLLYDNFLKYHFRPLMSDLGMSHTIHDTRHTFISMIVSAGIDKLTIKRIVGHSSKDITDRYTHQTILQMIDAIDQIK